MANDYCQSGRPGEGGLTDNHLIENAGQAVDVASGICLIVSLLWAHISGGTDRMADAGDPVPGRFAYRSRDSEIADHGMATIK